MTLSVNAKAQFFSHRFSKRLTGEAARGKGTPRTNPIEKHRLPSGMGLICTEFLSFGRQNDKLFHIYYNFEQDFNLEKTLSKIALKPK